MNKTELLYYTHKQSRNYVKKCHKWPSKQIRVVVLYLLEMVPMMPVLLANLLSTKLNEQGG